ncbi:MAG: glycosyltransferase family 9 protein [Ignavibacteriae bacterium]|nr:glycosyltransferase family 9 protein [Ignavibacteriota bacterium]
MLIRALIALLRLKGKLRKIRSLDPDSIHSILIVELTRLGDVITMLPTVRVLAKHFPHATIRILADERYASFLRSFNLPCSVSGVVNPETSEGFLSAVAFVRTQKVDLAISISPPKRNAAVALASGALRKVGYLAYSDTLTPYLTSHCIESFGCRLNRSLEFGRENIELRSLKICDALGIARGASDTRLTIDHTEKNALLETIGIPRKCQLIVLHPFSGWLFRSWGLDRFNELASTITTRLNSHVLFLCEKGEERKLEASRKLFAQSKRVWFYASDNLMDTAAILQEADLLVCNDSGPLHLAAALGVRTVALFGPSTPDLTGPRTLKGEYLYKQLECSPCNQMRCIHAGSPCMTYISPDEVYQSVMRQLPVQLAASAVANA